MNIETDLKGLVELVSNVTDAYTTAVLLADNKKRLLRLWHYYSLSDNVNPNAQIQFGVGPIGAVAESKREFDLVKFADRDSDLLGIYLKNENIKSFFAVPIISKDGSLDGVIAIDSKRSFVFSNKEQKILKLFAEQFSGLINNLKIKNIIDTEISDIDLIYNFCNKMRSFEDIEAIARIMNDFLIRLFEFKSYFIALKFKDGEFRVVSSINSKNLQDLVFSENNGLAGCIIREKKPILIANRKKELGYIFKKGESLGYVRSFLGVPIVYKENVLGIVCLIDDKEETFDIHDQQVLSIIADHASLAIANVNLQSRIRSLSTNIDGLTGLANYTGFNEYLDNFGATLRKRKSLSLMVIDIDHFNEINNTNGYEVGNDILRQMAKYLLDNDPKSNIHVSRYSADQFAMILPDISLNRALQIADEICTVVKEPMFILPDKDINISVSIGVSCFPENSINKHELINNALQALSIAKSRGGGIAWTIENT